MAEQNNIIKNKDSNQDDEIKIIEITENNKVIDEKIPDKIPENKKEEIKIDKNDNIIIIKEIEDKNNQKEKEKNIEEKLEMIMKELKKKDVIIKVMKDNMDIFKKKQEAEMKELKESQAKELNQLKQNYEKEINELKKNLVTKEDIKYLAKRREVDFVKEDLDSLNTKFSNLENEYNSKMGFIEANMEKAFKNEENKIQINQNKDNNNENNNQKNNNNIINNNLIQDYFDEKRIEAMKNESKKQYDMRVYKDLNNILKDIFSEKNLSSKDIDKKNLDKLKSVGIKLLKEKKYPLNFFSDFTKDLKINLSIHNINFNHKKIEIYKMFDGINNEILPTLNNAEKEKDLKKLDVKNFSVEAFRKEYNLSEKDFSDEVIKEAFMKCNGNAAKAFYKLVFKK